MPDELYHKEHKFKKKDMIFIISFSYYYLE